MPSLWSSRLPLPVTRVVTVVDVVDVVVVVHVIAVVVAFSLVYISGID